MRFNKKSQLAMEYLILFGVIVVAVVSISFFVSKENRKIVNSEVDDFSNIIIYEINNAVSSGEGKSKRVQLLIPDKISDFYYFEKNLFIYLYDKESSRINFNVNVPVVGEIINGEVFFEYINSSGLDYVCIYPLEKRQECCFDFNCNMDSLD
jgi:hypothetical protein